VVTLEVRLRAVQLDAVAGPLADEGAGLLLGQGGKGVRADRGGGWDGRVEQEDQQGENEVGFVGSTVGLTPWQGIPHASHTFGGESSDLRENPYLIITVVLLPQLDPATISVDVKCIRIKNFATRPINELVKTGSPSGV
jgi:hypothetical protein